MARPKTFDRDAVLDKAMRVFWRQGYEATSVRDLVTATGINRASMYDTFGDKRGLFLASVDRYVNAITAMRLGMLDAPGPALATLRAFFDDLIRFSIGEGRRLGCMMTNTSVELAPHDEEIGTLMAEALGRVEDAFFRLLTRAEAQGEIPPGRDLRAHARFLLATLNGLRVLARAKPDEAALRDVVETALVAVEGPRARA